MPKTLNARQIATAPTGKHRVDRGLYLLVSPTNARSWIFRGWDGTREIVRGLGAVADVPLTAARQAAVRLRAGLLDGAADLPRRGRAVRAIVHTWRDVFNRLRSLKAGTVRPATLRAQDSIWNVHVEPVFGSRDVMVFGTVGLTLGTLGLIFSVTALRKINELEARLAKEAPRED